MLKGPQETVCKGCRHDGSVHMGERLSCFENIHPQAPGAPWTPCSCTAFVPPDIVCMREVEEPELTISPEDLGTAFLTAYAMRFGQAKKVDCQKCHWMHNRVHPRDDDLHCYMFKDAPKDNKCAQFKAN